MFRPLGKPAHRLRKFAIGSVLAGTVYAASPRVRDDVDFAVHAVQRSTTVASALGRCVFYYRRTLNKTYANEEERAAALSACHTRCAAITRAALERNAGIFIKLGQHISALTYILPEEWTTAMIPLQDRCPVTPFSAVQQLVDSELGPMGATFHSFDPEPLGTASLAQVHRATLASGQEVAVKVQHPELQRYVPLDVRLTATTFRLVDFFFPEYPLRWLSDEMRRSIYTELNFEEEARNATKTAEYFAKFYSQTALRVPEVYWAKKRVICMEFLRGIRPDNKVELEAQGVDLTDLSRCFSHIFNNMVFTPGVGLHCDPHAGNIAIRPCKTNKHGFEIVLYDHGLYRYVDNETRSAYAHFWLALMDRDIEGMKRYAHAFAGISDSDFKIFAAAITGRDFSSSVDGSVFEKQRSQEEIEHMQTALQQQQGLPAQIMQMLHRMPPVVLLIFKTNDLVRYLDEQLGSPLGVAKEFVIMAKYCSRTVFSEERQKFGVLKAWLHYYWTQLRLAAWQLVA